MKIILMFAVLLGASGFGAEVLDPPSRHALAVASPKLIIRLDSAPGSSGAGFFVSVAKPGDANQARRKMIQSYVSLVSPKDRTGTFSLKEVRGSSADPELVLELLDTGKKVSLTRANPFIQANIPALGTEPEDFRVFQGEVVNTRKDGEWSDVSRWGRFVFQSRQTNALIAMSYKFKTEYVGPQASSQGRRGGLSGGAVGGIDPSLFVMETKDKAYGEQVAILNCTNIFLTGEDVTNVRMRRNGTYLLNGMVLAAYDCGTFDERCTIAASNASVQANAELAQERARADAQAQKAAAEIERKNTEADQRLLAWHQQQASNGSASAQCSLGLRYLTGKGVPQDETLGRQWLEKSAAQNNIEAKAALAKLTNSPAAPGRQGFFSAPPSPCPQGPSSSGAQAWPKL